MSKLRPLPQFIRALMGLVILGTTQCNVGRCEELRDKLNGLKADWQRCQKDDDCIVVGGSSKDCSGILSCNFAVNRIYRSEAERVVASLPETTVDCIECSSPNCIGGETAQCDRVTWRCSTAIVTLLPDASSIDITNDEMPTSAPANGNSAQQ